MRRLIEEAFPLRKVSEDSKHEKSAGRKGHISTLHIWPARRPLAASRAAVIAALLPDPAEAPQALRREYEALAGSPDPARQREALCECIGKVTRWGGEDQGEIGRLRDLIKQAYGGQAPRVLDLFSGGGAIPLEAMRLGCEAVAIEYNPVAWFILKCTLELPSKLAGRKWPLPVAGGDQFDSGIGAREGDLAAQVRHWGTWVRAKVEEELAPYFPKIDGQDPVAYFWARTVPCQDPKCGATVPLLKTLWLCTKPGHERALRLVPDATTRQVVFEVFTPENKSEVGGATVSNAKAFCPFHERPLVITRDHIRSCGTSGRMGVQLTAVAVQGENGKEYRAATAAEVEASERAVADVDLVMAQLPYGPLHELLCDVEPVRPPNGTRGVAGLTKYGILHWGQVFAPRQQLSLGVIAKWTRAAHDEVMRASGDVDLAEAVVAYLYCVLARAADRNSSICTWQTAPEKVRNTLAKYALPMTWDFCEVPPGSGASGGLPQALEWVADVVEHVCEASQRGPQPTPGSASCVRGHCRGAVPSRRRPQLTLGSARQPLDGDPVQSIVTDPPYYGAIPYADLSDFFYVWLRRVVGDRYPEKFADDVVPRAEELIQHAAYADGDHDAAKRRYEDGMILAFKNATDALDPDGSMVIVFANKEPDAWDALVTALIRAGCTVTGSWPIDTERSAKLGADKAAHLSTSVWLVCRRRPATAGIGRYSEVQKRMQERISERLRYFWDQGISGPDFIWAAVGPALEAYSRYKEVRRLDGSAFKVSDFLREVRRLVTDFALGQILHGASTEGLDEWTRYYLMHRSSFGLAAAPAGESILLAQGYNLDLTELRGARGLLGSGKKAKSEDDDDEGGSGSDVRLLAWDERKREDLGLPHASGGLPLIDALHRMQRLWSAGETAALRIYADEQGFIENDRFWTVAQAVLEMSEGKERANLEALVAWGRGASRPHLPASTPALPFHEEGAR